jgi:outer membrane protein assembly factor BamB
MPPAIPMSLLASLRSPAPALVLLGASLFSPAAHAAANWPHWRGPTENGHAAGANLPAKIDAAQVHWKTPLPGKGCSTPIVWNQRIYLTAPHEGKDAVLAFDWAGQRLWQTDLGVETPGRHRNGSGSNPSPVTDGQRLFVAFKSGNLAALDLDGKLLWQTDLAGKFGPVKLFWDFGTSPTVTEKFVIMARMHEGDSWLAAFDKQTGELRWKTARNYPTPREVDNGYTTPLVIRHAGREALLTWGAQHLTAHDAADGKLLWSCGGFNPDSTPLWPAVASPVVVGDMAIVCFGRADKGAPRLHGIKLGGSGDVTATHRVWSRQDTGAFVPTPAAYQDRVYVLSDRGQLDCLDPRTGQTLWSGTLPRTNSNFYTSPLIANGLLYAAREDGATYVVRIEKGFEPLGETKFDDRVIASFVAAGDRLFIRGASHLYCMASP